MIHHVTPTDAATRALMKMLVESEHRVCRALMIPQDDYRAMLADVGRELSAMRSPAADAVRLDWLDAQRRQESGSYGYTDPRNIWSVYGRGEWSHNQKAPHGIEEHPPHDTIRSAIDAAIGTPPHAAHSTTSS